MIYICIGAVVVVLVVLYISQDDQGNHGTWRHP